MSLRHKASRGFTLIELLVAMTIGVILIGGAAFTISFGDATQQLKEDAQRLRALIIMAADEAVLNSKELGIRFFTTGYVFYQLDTRGEKALWKPVGDDPRLRERQLVDGIDLLVEVDGTLIVLDPPPEAEEKTPSQFNTDDDETKDELRPNIMLLSTGDILQTFSVTLSLPDAPTQYTVRTGEESLVEFVAERDS